MRLKVFCLLALLLTRIQVHAFRTSVHPLQDAWVVVDFQCDGKKSSTNLPQFAAKQMMSELSRVTHHEIVPRPTLKRMLDTLSLRQPLVDKNHIMRLGQNLKASTVVTGCIQKMTIEKDEHGKRAKIWLEVRVYDSASGEVVNMVFIQANSSYGGTDTSDLILYQEATKQATYQAAQEIQTHTLPEGTILNTKGGNSAVMNQGSRAGYQKGQRLIIRRGRELVAIAKVVRLDNNYSTVTVIQYGMLEGISPEDRVRPIRNYCKPNKKPDMLCDPVETSCKATAELCH